MNIRLIPVIALLVLSIRSPGYATQRPARIAVAANFMGAMSRIVENYEATTGNRIETVYSSTGKLYAQIRMGGPYDLFLAADEHRPGLLAKDGICSEPFVYAIGEAVLWSRFPSAPVAEGWQKVVSRSDVKRIAISSPQTAPYGEAAMKALAAAGLDGRVKGSLVYGHNVAQAFQFAYHGSADLCFTALSLALSTKGLQGRYWPIPEAPAVVQKGCVVNSSGGNEAVGDFLDFLRSEPALKVLHEYGYR